MTSQGSLIAVSPITQHVLQGFLKVQGTSRDIAVLPVAALTPPEALSSLILCHTRLLGACRVRLGARLEDSIHESRSERDFMREGQLIPPSNIATPGMTETPGPAEMETDLMTLVSSSV